MDIERKKGKKLTTIISLIAPLFTFLLGSGVVWNWMNYNLEKERSALQRKSVEIQEVKNSYDKMSQVADLNEKLTERFFQFSLLNDEYVVLLREYDEYDQTDQIKAGDIRHKMKNNRSRSNMLLEEITKLEKEIARIENREPRNLGSKVPILPPVIGIIKID